MKRRCGRTKITKKWAAETRKVSGEFSACAFFGLVQPTPDISSDLIRNAFFLGLRPFIARYQLRQQYRHLYSQHTKYFHLERPPNHRGRHCHPSVSVIRLPDEGASGPSQPDLSFELQRTETGRRASR